MRSGLLSAIVSPSSQTASIFPCNWFSNCADNYIVQTFTPTSVTINPGQSATLTWSLYNFVGGYGDISLCIDGERPCSITPDAPRVTTCAVISESESGIYTTGDCSSPLTGTGGTYTAAPSRTTTYYLCSDFVNSHGGSCEASTVYVTSPTPTTFNSLTASPPAIPSGGGTTIGYSFTPGSGFYGCDLTGGNWGSGAYWLPAAASYGSAPLTAANNTINVACYDNNALGWTAWHTITVPIAAAPVSAGATSNSPVTVGQSATISFHADSATAPTQCQINNYNDTVALDNVAGCPSSANDTYTTPVFTTPGTYAYKFYYYQSGWTLVQTVSVVVNAAPPVTCANGLNGATYPSCTCPSGQVQSGSSCIVAPVVCGNGLNSATYPSCTCPSGQVQSGSSCITAPLCANGLANSYAPSCTCPSGQYQPLGSSSCVALPICANGLSQAYSPSCTCPSGQEQTGASCILAGSINSLTASPSRVLKGNTTTVSWSTGNMATCALSGFDASATSNLSSALSSSVNPTVNAKTIYTLGCIDKAGVPYSSSVTVNLIPQTIEL